MLEEWHALIAHDDLITLNFVKEAAPLEDVRWKELLHTHHLDSTPSLHTIVKKIPYSKLLMLVWSDVGLIYGLNIVKETRWVPITCGRKLKEKWSILLVHEFGYRQAVRQGL